MRKYEKRCWGLWLLMLVILASVSFVGCKAKLPPEKETTSVTVTETLHDTVFKTEADSSAIKALIDCQNGKPVLKQIQEAKPGKRMPPPKLTLKDNVLSCDCTADSLKLYAFWKSKQVTKEQIKQKPVLIEKPPTWWETTKIWIGNIALVLLFLLIAYKIIKNKLKTLKSKNDGKRNI